MANREACELWIEQESKELLAQGLKPPTIGKILSEMVLKYFEARIAPNTLEQRERRMNVTNVIPKPLSCDNNSELLIRKESGKGSPGEPRKYQAPPTFNRQIKEGIEWAGWSWNPVSGCKHGCDYCYARDIANRFYPEHIKFKPHFYPDRLQAPQNTPIPESPDLTNRLVFTVSMGDLFGEWVPQEWIDAILEAVSKSPDYWIYLFLTKNPKRLPSIDFPDNCWIGATADTQARATEAIELFYGWKNRPAVLFLSCEPLLERIELTPNASCLDWLIIGGQTGANAKQPEWEWVELLHDQARENDIALYYKPNLTVRPMEYPGK